MNKHLILTLFALTTIAGLACSGNDDFDGRPMPDRPTGKDGGPMGAGSGGGGRGGGSVPQKDGGSGEGGVVEGSCGLNCFVTATGPGTSTPFDLDGNPADHVGLDPDGSIVIERDADDTEELIWIANTSEGTVSKVDTNALVELGRYFVPAVDFSVNNSTNNGPSRTTVDSEGSVYAAARFANGISKISAAGDACPDTNGDGAVTTSSGPNDILPTGQDDCVLWTTSLVMDARGAAVEEIPTRFEVEMSPDGEPIITEIPGARYVWVGAHKEKSLYKLDAETGQVLMHLLPANVPTDTYGLALDGRGNLWFSGRDENAIGRLDTTRCVDDTCNMEAVCTTVCSETSCPDTCDGAVLERIELGQMTYGITVDCVQRVWIGGAHGSGQLGVLRYDPLAPADMRLTAARNIAGAGVDGIHGIAADGSGWVWGGARDQGVWRIDAETMQSVPVADTAGAKGMAVDRQGRVWAIPYRDDYAMVITPGLGINDATVQRPGTLTPFVGPYTYSDMTGEQRRLAANDPGYYSQVFQGCGEVLPTEWKDLQWDVETPAGTFVVFRARTANTVNDLQSADWFEVTAVPGRKSPIALEPYITGAGQTPGAFIEIQVGLFTTELGEEGKCSSVPATTPRVKGFGVSYLCDPEIE